MRRWGGWEEWATVSEFFSKEFKSKIKTFFLGGGGGGGRGGRGGG